MNGVNQEGGDIMFIEWTFLLVLSAANGLPTKEAYVAETSGDFVR